MRLTSLIDWPRLALAVPLLSVAGVAAFLLIPHGGTGATPRAALVDTPPGPTQKIGVHKGQLARDFIGSAPDGTQVRLSELRGRPTVINFWATWCTSCLAELPDLKAVQQEIGSENLNVLAVNAGEDASVAARFLDELDAAAFRVAMDPTLVVADAYGVFGMPTSVFLDSDGVVRAIYVGQLSKELMQEYVRAATTSADVSEPPPEIRLITTIARDHLLEVKPLADGLVELRSKSLRCDESYCAESAIVAFETSDAIRTVERHLSEDPARIVVVFDPTQTDADALATKLAEALNQLGDPLYERPLEIVRR